MPTQHSDEIDLIVFLRMLWDSKYVVLVITALFGFASLFVAFTATPIYRADVVVARISDTGMTGAASLASQFGGLGRLAGLDLGQSGSGQEAQAVLESRQLTEEFIERNELLSEVLPSDGEPSTLWRAVRHFRDLVVSIHEDSAKSTTTVSMEWTDPAIAARWANDYVALANELIRSRALKESESNIEYLRNQVGQTTVVELERVIYNLIETEIQTLMLANARDEYAFSIVDPAVAPEMRIWPRRKVIVLSGGALGVFFGVLAVFVVSIFRQVRLSLSDDPA